MEKRVDANAFQPKIVSQQPIQFETHKHPGHGENPSHKHPGHGKG